MYKYFRTLAPAFIAMMCIGFISCSDDNDEPNPGEQESSVTVNPLTVFSQGAPSQVGDYVITKNAQGLVTKIVDDDEVTTFDYTPAKTSKSRASINIPTDYDMTMNVEWGNDENGVDFYIKLNKQGYIEYAYEIDEDKWDGIHAEEWWFKYDEAGRMIEMKRTEGDNEITTITYNVDGDIVKVAVKDDEDGNTMETTVAYTDASHSSPILNTSGIMLYDDSFRIDMDEMAPAYFAGLLGKGTTHLPLSAIEEGLECLEPRITYIDDYTFTWVLNSENMPTSFTSTYTHTWDGGSYTYTEDPILIKW